MQFLGALSSQYQCLYASSLNKREFYISAVWGSRRKQSLSEIKEIQKCLQLRQIKNSLFLQKVIVNFYVELLKDFMADHGLPNSEKICSPKCRYETRQWSCCTMYKACIRGRSQITLAQFCSFLINTINRVSLPS